jgi:hypothetical protein
MSIGTFVSVAPTTVFPVEALRCSILSEGDSQAYGI